MKARLADVINRSFWTILDWVYPPVCAGCDEPGYRLCPSCQEKINIIRGNRCQICGEPLTGSKSICHACHFLPPAYTAMRNFATYEGVVRECIHALKYENNQGLGEFFVDWLVKIVLEERWLIDVVMPVPLSSIRMRERGYNQSALIARPLATRLAVHYNPFGLQRIRDTQSQVGLSGEERRQNVLEAFEAVPAIVDGMKVLLVDDVMTTGATMSACANALNLAGAKAVYCLTIARFAAHKHGSSVESHQV